MARKTTEADLVDLRAEALRWATLCEERIATMRQERLDFRGNFSTDAALERHLSYMAAECREVARKSCSTPGRTAAAITRKLAGLWVRHSWLPVPTSATLRKAVERLANSYVEDGYEDKADAIRARLT